jgi:peroxiredoxin
MNQSEREVTLIPIRLKTFFCLIIFLVIFDINICRAGLKPDKDNIVKDVTELKDLYETIIPVGVKAPDFKLKDLDGKVIDSSDFFGRHITLLYFWSVSCPYCRKSLPRVEEIYKKFKVRGLKVIAVNLDGLLFENAVRNYLADINVKLLMPLDELNEKNKFFTAADPYGVNKTPSVFLVNEDGEIVYGTEYDVDYDQLEEVINKSIGKKFKKKIVAIVLISIGGILIMSISAYIFYVRPKNIQQEMIEELKRRTKDAHNKKKAGS